MKMAKKSFILHLISLPFIICSLSFTSFDPQLKPQQNEVPEVLNKKKILGHELLSKEYFLFTEPVISIKGIHFNDTEGKEEKIDSEEYARRCSLLPLTMNPSMPSGLKEVKKWTDGLISVGKHIWPIVQKGIPVLVYKNESLSVLPKDAEEAFLLEQWSCPYSLDYEVLYKNLWNMNVITFNYKIIYTPGGRWNGTGRYLTNVTIIPNSIEVSYGYSFNASVNFAHAVNVGTKADPVAGAQVNLNWEISTFFKATKNQESFFMDGNGEFKKL